MGKDNATVLQDGQLAVATVPQTGTIISEASKVDATALVQTDDGPQLCVKTYDLNGGGGGGGTVDQTYDPTSTNAQSGTAVAEAVAPALKNTATGTNSLAILGTITSNFLNTIAIGSNAVAQSGGATIIGNGIVGDYNTIAIGSFAFATKRQAIAIGGANFGAKAEAVSAIQLGEGTNNTANSFQVYSYQMLDGTTGKIPMARLPIVQLTQADYDALVSGGTVDANTIYCIVPA